MIGPSGISMHRAIPEHARSRTAAVARSSQAVTVRHESAGLGPDCQHQTCQTHLTQILRPQALCDSDFVWRSTQQRPHLGASLPRSWSLRLCPERRRKSISRLWCFNPVALDTAELREPLRSFSVPRDQVAGARPSWTSTELPVLHWAYWDPLCHFLDPHFPRDPGAEQRTKHGKHLPTAPLQTAGANNCKQRRSMAKPGRL